MSNSNFKVDTAKVEEAARKVRAVASQVQELATQDVSAMLELARTDLEGNAAEALQETLTDLNSDILKIASGLTTIQKQLNAYARRVKEVDAEIAARIGGR